jgi:hypothetical protein
MDELGVEPDPFSSSSRTGSATSAWVPRALSQL